MPNQLSDSNNLARSPSRPYRALLDGRYVLKFPLAYQASGTAWGALDTFEAGPRRVVVKFVKHLVNGDPNELVLLRARQASIPWKSVVALPLIEELGGFDASPFLVFGWRGGEALNPHLQSTPNGMRLSFPAVTQLAQALAALHGAGLLHLDLAPTSVVYDTKTRALRLIDWGHALPVHHPASTYLARVASAAYAGIGMRPGGTPSMRDDVYSAACMIYELLSGHHPYGLRTATEAAFRHLVPAPIDRLNRPNNALLARALDASQRQPVVMMAELAEMLASAERGAVATLAREKLTPAATMSGGMHTTGGATIASLIAPAPIRVTRTLRGSDPQTMRQRRPAYDGGSERRPQRRAPTSNGLPFGIALTAASIAIGVVAATWLAHGDFFRDRHNAGVAIGALSGPLQLAAGVAAMRSATLEMASAQTTIDRR